MPRPKSDLVKVAWWLSPADLDALDRIAQRLGLVVEAGASKGRPNRTEALRHAIRHMDNPGRKKSGKKSPDGG